MLRGEMVYRTEYGRITFWGGRQQPYTVWFRNEIIGFDATKEAALARLEREESIGPETLGDFFR